MLPPNLAPYEYVWPQPGTLVAPAWQRLDGTPLLARPLPESVDELARDSRWPALFPSPICIVTVADGEAVAMERVVGPSIVNRFPYVMALSLCVEDLSGRHYARSRFVDMLASGKQAAIQFLVPGAALDAALGAIADLRDSQADARISATRLPTRRAFSNSAPVFKDAYLVYEGRLIAGEASIKVGSHRVFFLQINAIQLREDIAQGRESILWRSLPTWDSRRTSGHIKVARAVREAELARLKFQKPYTAHYRFPAPSTVAFEATAHAHGMAIRELPPDPAAQVEVDNDRARWPCFFPSSVGVITSRAADGRVAVMPCGSTTVVSRHPMVIAPCISYNPVNERYAARATLDIIRESGRFACGVPFISDEILEFIGFTGNISLKTDPDKLAKCGLDSAVLGANPVLLDLPVTFDCRVIGEKLLGTHAMVLGEVERVFVREDVSERHPLRWCPWATVSG